METIFGNVQFPNFKGLDTKQTGLDYRKAALGLLGSALGGVLGGLISPELGAGIVKGGTAGIQNLLNLSLQEQKTRQNLHNKLATEVFLLDLKNRAQQLQDEQRRKILSLYGEELENIYKNSLLPNGSFDVEKFMHEASLLGTRLGIDPDSMQEIRESFLRASQVANKINAPQYKTFVEPKTGGLVTLDVNRRGQRAKAEGLLSQGFVEVSPYARLKEAQARMISARTKGGGKSEKEVKLRYVRGYYKDVLKTYQDQLLNIDKIDQISKEINKTKEEYKEDINAVLQGKEPPNISKKLKRYLYLPEKDDLKPLE